MNLKGTLPTLILEVLAHEPSHGYRIAQKIKQSSDGLLDFKEGTLYPALHKLENEGAVESYEGVESGRARRYYRITESGRKALDRDRVEWQQLSGSIWSSEGRMVRLGTDAKAVRIHDVVSIVVIETLSASTDGQVKNVRASNANSNLTALFGALKASNSLQNLVGQNSSSGLTAQGQSTTNSSLSTTFGGEVVDVLPNGMLVVQATRQLTFSQQTQLIKLRGLVRPEDVSAQNQVLSTAITDLELEVTGKGIVSDSTYRQNPLVRWLERLIVF